MKKLSKLILAAIMAAGMFSLFGCIENIEPAGIADLRGAKAELMRAQTALEAAKAAKVQAEAAMLQAQAKVQEAIAKQEEAKVEYFKAQAEMMKHQAELESIKNEAEREKLNLLIEQNKLAMVQAQNAAALAAAQLEKDLLAVQTALAREQAEYEKALKALELAKVELDPAAKAKVTLLQTEIESARNVVYLKTDAYKKAGAALTSATAEADPQNSLSLGLRLANKAVADAKAVYDAALEAEKLAKEMTTTDATLDGWVKTLDELKKQKETLMREADAADAANFVRMSEIEDSVQTVVIPMVDEYSDYTGYEFNDITGKFSIVPGSPRLELEVPEVYIKLPEGVSGSDFSTARMTYRYGHEKVILDEYDSYISDLKRAMNVEYMQVRLANYEKQLADFKASDRYKMADVRYKDAVAAYTTGDLLTYLNKYVYIPGEMGLYPANYDVNATFKGYNDALAAFEKSIKDYETAITAADCSKEELVLVNTLNTELNDAEAKKAAAYKVATDARQAAEVVYVAAYGVHEDATVVWERCKTDNDYHNREYMQSWIEQNPTKPTDPDKALIYDDFKRMLANLDKGEKDYNLAKEAFLKAKGERTKAITQYNTATRNADQAYFRAVEDANRKYENAYNSLVAGKPKVNRQELRAKIENAKAVLAEKMDNVHADVEYNIAESPVRSNINYILCKGTLEQYEVTVSNVASYLVKETYDPAYNRTERTLKAITLDEIKDLEVFKKTHLESSARYMVSFEIGYQMNGRYYYNNEITTEYVSYNDVLKGPKYPVELVNYDTYLVDIENYAMRWSNRAERDLITALENQGYRPMLESLRQTHVRGGILINEFEYLRQIELLKKRIANASNLTPVLAAVEKARAEFVAHVAKDKERLEALRVEVEAIAPRMFAEYEKLESASDAMLKKVQILTSTITKYETLIKGYCNGLTKEEFDAALKAEYEAAVDATFAAETKHLEAQKALEETKAGLVTAVETAKLNLEKAETELNAAKDRLDKLVAELDALVKVLYGAAPSKPAA